MSADQPLTGDDLATIKRNLASIRKQYADDVASWLIFEDVPRLVAEIERLQALVTWWKDAADTLAGQVEHLESEMDGG